MEGKKIIGIGFVIFLLLFCGYASVLSNEEYESQIGSTLDKRQEQLQQYDSTATAEIVLETELDENGSYIVSVFEMYNGQQSGIAFFEKQENGSYQYKSSFWMPSGSILEDSLMVNGTKYIVFYLNQPDLSYAKVRFTANGEVWTDTYETNGLLIVKKPDEIAGSFQCDVEYYDINKNVYE